MINNSYFRKFSFGLFFPSIVYRLSSIVYRLLSNFSLPTLNLSAYNIKRYSDSNRRNYQSKNKILHYKSLNLSVSFFIFIEVIIKKTITNNNVILESNNFTSLNLSKLLKINATNPTVTVNQKKNNILQKTTFSFCLSISAN